MEANKEMVLATGNTMRAINYLLTAVLLTGCGSVVRQDETPNPTQEEVREKEVRGNIRKAEQGDAKAQSVLGLTYSLGLGVPQDSQEAVKWYRRAAEQGDAGAQSNLGWMYEKGQVVPKDDVLAYKWYNLAAAQEYEIATENRDIIAKKMNTSQIQEAQILAREFNSKKENP